MEHAHVQLVKSPLAGSSVWFDHELVRNHFPRTFETVSYRQIDMSSLQESARRQWPVVKSGQPAKRGLHRAMSDLEDSINLARYYAAAVAPAPAPAAAA